MRGKELLGVLEFDGKSVSSDCTFLCLVGGLHE
jgi:hypothetical protein